MDFGIALPLVCGLEFMFSSRIYSLDIHIVPTFDETSGQKPLMFIQKVQKQSNWADPLNFPHIVFSVVYSEKKKT